MGQTHSSHICTSPTMPEFPPWRSGCPLLCRTLSGLSRIQQLAAAMPLLRCVLTLIRVCLWVDQKLPVAVVEVARGAEPCSHQPPAETSLPHCSAQEDVLAVLCFSAPVRFLAPGSRGSYLSAHLPAHLYSHPATHLSIYPGIGQELQGKSHSFCHRKGKNFKPSHLEWSHHEGTEVL